MTVDAHAASSPDFLRELRARARARHHRLVFPEGTEPRVHQALVDAVSANLFVPVLLGPPDEIRDGLADVGVDPGAVEVIDPLEADRIDRYGAVLHDLRRHKGVTQTEAAQLVRDPLLQGALMVRADEVQGSVAGCVRTTGDVVVSALWGVGIAEGIRTVSSSFYMAFGPEHPHGPSVLTFTDAGVLPDPTPHQLAEIAVAAVRARQNVVGDEARVAFLSYSTHGSAEGPAVDKVREALEHFRRLMPGVTADGELQADAALVREVAHRKAPESAVGGAANVLVFPDLNAANIAYKLVQHLGGAHALGPILQGLARPCNDLSRGASPADIVSVACITALMAG